MPTQIEMNHNGDTRHYFDANDATALAKAEERFKQQLITITLRTVAALAGPL